MNAQTVETNPILAALVEGPIHPYKLFRMFGPQTGSELGKLVLSGKIVQRPSLAFELTDHAVARNLQAIFPGACSVRPGSRNAYAALEAVLTGP